MKATIFIVASTVGLQYPEVNYSHFTWAQAREMRESGLIEIGSHTYSHDNMSLLSYDKVNLDLRLSKYLIDTNLNYDCTLLAFPYGLCTEENQQQALDAGYELSCIVGDVGVNTKYTPITALKRLTIYGTYTSDNLIHYIEVETQKELEQLNAQ
jgi:peptidoglycan/xylan/chitin deacetylase (PgdA/CDA1 family)